MTLWRIHLQPEHEDDINPVDFCRERNILGVGWPVDVEGPIDWETYKELAGGYDDEGPGWWKAVNALHNRMENGDLCWTRHGGKYYLGRVEGKWEYRNKEEYRKADIVNVRACGWSLPVEVDSVPGKVVNALIRGGALQRVRDDTALFYSQCLYNYIFERQIYFPDPPDELDLFQLIGSENCEDIVGLYLQEELGYRLIPSTCKTSTAETEFVLKNREGERANVQVKQGEVSLNRDDYNDPSCDWFLFTTKGWYTGMEYSQVHCLQPDEMERFAFDNRKLMTQRVQAFIRFIESVSHDDRAMNQR